MKSILEMSTYVSDHLNARFSSSDRAAFIQHLMFEHFSDKELTFEEIFVHRAAFEDAMDTVNLPRLLNEDEQFNPMQWITQRTLDFFKVYLSPFDREQAALLICRAVLDESPDLLD